MKSVVLFGNIGCFLPFLIIFNLFFGWIFLRPAIWLGLEAVLLLILLLSLHIFSKSIRSSMRADSGHIIDVEAEVLKDDAAHKRVGKKDID